MDELLKLAWEISPWWKHFARCLYPCGMREQEILGVAEKYCTEGVVTQSIVMLQTWHRQYGACGTVLHLCEASLKARCRLATENVFGREQVQEVYAAGDNKGKVSCATCSSYVRTGRQQDFFKPWLI